jgi:hypothetical protein
MSRNSVTTENLLKDVLDLLKRLDEAKIHYRVAHNQEDAITVEVAVPGQRWEIDCYGNGATEVEIFRSDGSIKDGSAIEQLFRDFSD